MGNFQSWYTTTLTKKLEPSSTNIFLENAATITSGRVYLTNDSQEEWINFGDTDNGWLELIDLTRNLSKTADPATWWTWLTWLAWSEVKIVFMHDQHFDKQRPGSVQFADVTARDTALWGDWVAVEAFTSVYTIAEWLFWNYNLSTAQWEAIDSWTVTPNASELVAGKVEISTNEQALDWDDIGESWAPLVIKPSQLRSYPAYIFGDWGDWDETISVNTEITWDLYQYENLTIDSWFTLTINNSWLTIIKVRQTLTIEWIIDLLPKWGVVSEILFWKEFATTWVDWWAWETRSQAWWSWWTGWIFNWGWWGWGGCYVQTWWNWWAWSPTIASRLWWDAVNASPWGNWNPWVNWGWGSGWERWWALTSWYGWWDDEASLNGWNFSGISWSSFEWAWGWGWAWWINWSVVFIIANNIVWAWNITANWENGYNGWNWWGWAWTESWGWGGWGWGWGAWGQVWIIYKTSTQTWWITVTAWTWWTKWTWTNAPTWWANWNNWTAWVSDLRDIKYLTN